MENTLAHLKSTSCMVLEAPLVRHDRCEALLLQAAVGRYRAVISSVRHAVAKRTEDKRLTPFRTSTVGTYVQYECTTLRSELGGWTCTSHSMSLHYAYDEEGNGDFFYRMLKEFNIMACDCWRSFQL